MTFKRKKSAMTTPQNNPYYHSAPETSGGKKKWIFIALAVLIVFAIGVAASGGEKDSTASSFKATPATESEFAATPEVSDVAAPSPTIGSDATRDFASLSAEPAAAAEEDRPTQDSKLPLDFHSALSQAKTYSEMMHMSKQGIYDQLTSEYGGQFGPDAAQYAIDNLEADYNYNALEQARNYMDIMPMSMNELYDQLVSEYGEQFTPEEAQYAIDNLEG